MAGLVIEALQGILGQLPTAEQTALVMAQIWLENGRGRAFIQYNWGNHSTYPNKNVPYWRPSWYEVTEASSARLRALHEKMLAGEAPQAFRAFDSHAQGLAHHFRTFQPGQRYHPLLTAAATGDPLAFAQAIWDTRYTRDYAPAVAAKSYGTLAKELLQKGLFDSLPKAEPASLLSAAVPDCSSLSDSDSEVGLSLGTYETALRAELHVPRRGSRGKVGT